MRKRTKILYIITSLGLGGAEKLLYYYLTSLNKDKYEFFVCSLRDKPDDLLFEITKHSQVYKCGMKSKFNPLVILNLIRIIRSIAPDIIHTHLFQPRVYASLAYLFCKPSILITQKHNNVNPKKHNIFILVEMLCILINKKVIAISESVKNSLIKYELVQEKKIFVLPNCVDIDSFYGTDNRNIEQEDKKIILGTVGRLEKQKGTAYLLVAMKKIIASFPNIRLEIVGDGSLLENLKKLSIKLGISNSVIFFGKFVNVKPFYSRMDVFILPSIYEGFGIVLLEAMTMGVPVIATNVDGIKEIISNMKNGILVPVKNPEAIADAVIKVISDPVLRKNLIEEGYKRARQFDLKDHILKLDNFYTNLIGTES